jgi:hypothetical protein
MTYITQVRALWICLSFIMWCNTVASVFWGGWRALSLKTVVTNHAEAIGAIDTHRAISVYTHMSSKEILHSAFPLPFSSSVTYWPIEVGFPQKSSS